MTQPELFDAPHTMTRDEWIEAVSAFIPRYAQEHGQVCADDVHEHLPTPDGVDGRAIGAMLRGSGLRCVNYRRSRRPECHFRPIGNFVV